jgi:hypothetical protein
MTDIAFKEGDEDIPVKYKNNEDGSYTPYTSIDSTNVISTLDKGPGWTSVFGVSGAAVLSSDMTTAAHVTDTPGEGLKLVVTDIIVSVDTAMSVLFEDHTGADLIKVYMPANSTLQITPRSKMKLAVSGDPLTAKASATGNISVTVWYYTEA